jgi:hypothetical protein
MMHGQENIKKQLYMSKYRKEYYSDNNRDVEEETE